MNQKESKAFQQTILGVVEVFVVDATIVALLFAIGGTLVVQKSRRRLEVLGKGHFIEFNTSPHRITFLERGASRRWIGSWQAFKRG